MYLVDTDILIWAIRGRPDIVETLSELKEKNSHCISTISIAEIFQNVFPTELSYTEDFLANFVTFPIEIDIAKQGGFYYQQYAKNFRSLSLNDCLIAATAKEYNLMLLTLNVKHFPMEDIKSFDPLKKAAGN
ncbi:type II toxin-antitoxin system VapC family toxin [Candidatus Gottesmanbacteria bacterium]|nr:type II toxin-antitoxin system VapC family toxin [Candidatus Gottesmanbacteria bacterium]